MHDVKNKLRRINPSFLQIAGILLLILLTVMLLGFSSSNSTLASPALQAQVRFYGDYRIGDGPWQPISEGQHIPATQGDVTLRGNFHILTPDGEYIGICNVDTPIALYTNHISLTLFEPGCDPFMLDTEHPLYGDLGCGVCCTAYSLMSEGNEPIEILIHNPHSFGNDTAIDELISNLAFWSGIEYEKTMLNRGQNQRNSGVFVVIIALVLLGSALFSALLHIPNHQIIWLLGAQTLSAGLYLLYGSPAISFWSDSTAFNTKMLGLSKMFYMLFSAGIITYFLKNTKPIGWITTAIMGAIDGVFFLLPMLAGIYFFDTWLLWVIVQSAANIVLLVCLIKDFLSVRKRDRLVYVGMSLLLLAFVADSIANSLALWAGGFLSKYVFFVLFASAMFAVLRIIPKGINAAARAKELDLQRSRLEAEKKIMEAELKDSRVSLMLSQIQPHFIYNSLGTIERMCLKDPEKAFELVRNFSLYLRGNFSELDSVSPIRFAEELKHIEHYVHIEKVRFPDMNIEYNVETTDFILPALSVQPLVENAIKHGLMRLESGGTVVIHSYETPTHFCVEVTDDGVGFDPDLPMDEKKHVGIRNIRGRLKAMVNGELILESKVDVGTKAVIMIPKEVTT